MASVAEALQVGWVGEKLHPPTVRDDVIHVGRRDAEQMGLASADAPLPAAPAEGFPGKLLGPELIRPERELVKLVPLGGISATAVPIRRLVLGAVNVPGQRPAPGMSAGAVGIEGQKITSRAKEKDQSQRPLASAINSSGL